MYNPIIQSMRNCLILGTETLASIFAFKDVEEIKVGDSGLVITVSNVNFLWELLPADEYDYHTEPCTYLDGYEYVVAEIPGASVRAMVKKDEKAE